MKLRTGLTILIITALLPVLAGCENPLDKFFGKDPDTENPGMTDEEHIKDYEHINELPVVYFAPLTGMVVDHELTNRVIGVMINNLKPARPQSGLLEADIVYEVLAEGEITRLVAIYHSQEPETIGPVRSTRPYYIELITGLDGIVAHCGASQSAYDMLRNNNIAFIDDITKSAGAYWRVDFRNSPHNTYTSYNSLMEAANYFRYRLTGKLPELQFLDDAQIVKGDPAGQIKITYIKDYTVSYQYDEEKRIYYRSINGEAHTDLVTKQQLTARNILVVRTTHRILDSVGREAIDVNGPGSGYLFQNGVAREITWRRVDGVIRAYDGEREMPLYPGKTWVQVVRTDSRVNYQ